MPTALILGASRGIGRELARQYKADGWRTLGTARHDADLQNLEEAGIEPLKLDVASTNDWAALGWKLDSEKLDSEKLDVAIYNAGVYGDDNGSHAPPSDADFDLVMHTNVRGAMHALHIVAPCVAATKGRFGFISSRMGSIANADAANGWTYRASKAALNMLVHAAVTEHRDITLLTLSPGWVRTDMGGATATLDVQTSASGLRRTIAQATRAQSGAFLNYDGAPIAW